MARNRYKLEEIVIMSLQVEGSRLGIPPPRAAGVRRAKRRCYQLGAILSGAAGYGK